MTDYREKYKNEVGACASCKHIRSKEPGLRGDYIEYDGGRHAYCVGKHPTSSIVMHDTPDLRFQVNDCWEATKPEGGAA